MTEQNLPETKLYLLLLGSKAPGRHVEQHDFFFGIASSLTDLVPQIRAFWPEAGDKIHVDGWREVNTVDGYSITVREKDDHTSPPADKLFFINLGGYQEDKLEEQHYTILSVKKDRGLAIQDAKQSLFFTADTVQGTNNHIDDKYGIDVDDIYEIEDMLSPELKQKYVIDIQPGSNQDKDQIHLGYFKLDKL